MFSPQFTKFFEQLVQGNINSLSAHPAAAEALGEKATALWQAEMSRMVMFTQQPAVAPEVAPEVAA